MVLTLSEEEFLEMKRTILDEDSENALRLVRLLIKRLEQSRQSGLKSHLDQ